MIYPSEIEIRAINATGHTYIRLGVSKIYTDRSRTKIRDSGFLRGCFNYSVGTICCNLTHIHRTVRQIFIMAHGDGIQPPSIDYDIFTPITSASGLRQGLTAYGDQHFSLFLRKVFIKALGYSEDALSRPIIGIVNTHSGFNPCHANVPQLIEAVKRGVQLNGGLAIEFPTISVHESFAHPTSMILRNLMSMDTEEMIRAQPLDACIMIGGKSGPVL